MNIILVSPLPPPAGGIASWTREYLNSDECKANNVSFINSAVIGNRVNQLSKRKINDEFYRALLIRKRIKEILSCLKYDAIHYNSSGSTFGMLKDYFCLKQAKNKAKIVIHFHCDTSKMIKGIVARILFKKLCVMADSIICLNNSSYNHIRTIRRKNIIIIPNFISHNFISKTKIISDEIKTVIFVGHIIPSKGYYEILSIAEKFPNITFKLVGAFNEKYKSSKHFNVTYTGEINKDKVLQELISADLLLFPSHTEGFPMVILEAMSCGIPILSTNVGAIPEMIEGKGGKLVDIGDVDEMIRNIYYLQDKEIRTTMARWNIDKVLNNYTVDIVMKRIFKVYGD